MKIVKGNKTSFVIRPHREPKRRRTRKETSMLVGFTAISAGALFLFFLLLSLAIYDPAMLAPWLFISIQNARSAWLVK